MTAAGKMEIVMQLFDSGLLCECERIYMMPTNISLEYLHSYPILEETKLIVQHKPKCDGVAKVFEFLDKV